MQLSVKQKKYLRQLGHDLKPTVIVSSGGLSAGVLAELDGRLTHHELIKVKFAGVDRATRAELVASMLKSADAELVTRIGNVALVYRPRKQQPGILLP